MFEAVFSSELGSGPALKLFQKVPKTLGGHACAWHGQSVCPHVPGALWSTSWRCAALVGELVELLQ